MSPPRVVCPRLNLLFRSATRHGLQKFTPTLSCYVRAFSRHHLPGVDSAIDKKTATHIEQALIHGVRLKAVAENIRENHLLDFHQMKARRVMLLPYYPLCPLPQIPKWPEMYGNATWKSRRRDGKFHSFVVLFLSQNNRSDDSKCSTIKFRATNLCLCLIQTYEFPACVLAMSKERYFGTSHPKYFPEV